MTQIEKDLKKVQRNGCVLQYVRVQTPEICLTAVRQNGWALKFVKDQTPEICLEAVKQGGLSLQFVKSQTPEICMAAVSQNGYALGYVKRSLMCSDLYFLSISILEVSMLKFGSESLDNYVNWVSEVIGKKLDKHEIQDNIKNIKKGIRTLDILKNDMGYLQFIDPETLGAEDYHEILDYIIESDPELTDYQKKYLDRLGKL